MESPMFRALRAARSIADVAVRWREDTQVPQDVFVVPGGPTLRYLVRGDATTYRAVQHAPAVLWGDLIPVRGPLQIHDLPRGPQRLHGDMELREGGAVHGYADLNGFGAEHQVRDEAAVVDVGGGEEHISQPDISFVPDLLDHPAHQLGAALLCRSASPVPHGDTSSPMLPRQRSTLASVGHEVSSSRPRPPTGERRAYCHKALVPSRRTRCEAWRHRAGWVCAILMPSHGGGGADGDRANPDRRNRRGAPRAGSVGDRSVRACRGRQPRASPHSLPGGGGADG